MLIEGMLHVARFHILQSGHSSFQIYFIAM